MNLDQAACSGVFDQTLQDSGAIIVGAGQPPSSGGDRQREGFSSFGSRIDLQGWGSAVVTTGYGDLYTASDRPADPGFWYAGGFNGTSSAAAIVAGAVANLQRYCVSPVSGTTPSLAGTNVIGTDGKPTIGEYCRAYRSSSEFAEGRCSRNMWASM